MDRDTDAPDVGHLDRAAVHSLRWGSLVEQVPVAFFDFKETRGGEGMNFDWREFFRVINGFALCLWCGLMIGGTFMYDRWPLWAAVTHFAAGVLTVAVLSAVGRNGR